MPLGTGPHDFAYGRLATGGAYGDSATFLEVEKYENVQRWTKLIGKRPAARRGSLVNRTEGKGVIAERHSASDFETKTEA